MTCILGLEIDGKVYMGGDSASAEGWNIRETGLKKVFVNGRYLIGYSTSFRMGQLLQYANLPTYPVDLSNDRNDTLKFMVTEFVPAIRKAFTEAGYIKIDSNREEAGDFLVGLNGFLFHVSSDLQVNYFLDGYQAIGCGAVFSLGALSVLDRSVPISILKALEVAGKFSNGVCPPYYVESI